MACAGMRVGYIFPELAYHRLGRSGVGCWGMGRYKGSNCNAGVLDRDAALRSLENGSIKDIHALRFDRESIARAGGVEKAIRFGRHFRHAPPQWMACAGMRIGDIFPELVYHRLGRSGVGRWGMGRYRGQLQCGCFGARRGGSCRYFLSENGSMREMPPYFSREGHRQRIYMRCVSTE